MQPLQNHELCIIDGTAELFRMYFARIRFTNPDGVEAGAVLGSLQSITRVLTERRPTHMAVVFDSKEPTFRHHIYPQYKANRGAPPEKLVPQFDLLKAGVAALGIPSYALPGYEADDIMATLSQLGKLNDIPVMMVSSDKDLTQLIDDSEPAIKLFLPKQKQIWNAAAVVEKYLVRPDQMIDFQCLVGDSVDNIPGVPGIGMKTAAALLNQYDSIDQLLTRLPNEIPQHIRGAARARAQILGNTAQLAQSRQLVQLSKEVPLEGFSINELRWSGISNAEFFDSIGFHQPLRRMIDYPTLM